MRGSWRHRAGRQALLSRNPMLWRLRFALPEAPRRVPLKWPIILPGEQPIIIQGRPSLYQAIFFARPLWALFHISTRPSTSADHFLV